MIRTPRAGPVIWAMSSLLPGQGMHPAQGTLTRQSWERVREVSSTGRVRLRRFAG